VEFFSLKRSDAVKRLTAAGLGGKLRLLPAAQGLNPDGSQFIVIGIVSRNAAS
jgi:hypothetical protein